MDMITVHYVSFSLYLCLFLSLLSPTLSSRSEGPCINQIKIVKYYIKNITYFVYTQLLSETLLSAFTHS